MKISASRGGLALLGIVIIAPLSLPSPCSADEPLFGYMYTTDLQPRGKYEFEQWITDREGQAFGHFHHFDLSSEVEYGVTDNFQIAGYVNYMYANENGNSVRGLTEGIEVPFDHDPNTPYNAARFDGISLELMYRFLSPYLDPLGFSVYLEPEIGTWESGVEFRTIFQKNFFDDQWVLVLNAWAEVEHEKSSNLSVPGTGETDSAVPDGSYSTNTYAELDLGASFRIAPNWYVGLEFRNHNEYRGVTLSSAAQDHTALFLGPNVHYAAEHWFFTLSVIRQLGAVAYTDDQRAELYHGLLYGDEHTTWDGIRLKVGFPFN